MFSRRAPTNPAKLTIKTMAPNIINTNDTLSIISYTVSTFTKPVALYLSQNAYNPIAINNDPNN